MLNRILVALTLATAAITAPSSALSQRSPGAAVYPRVTLQLGLPVGGLFVEHRPITVPFSVFVDPGAGDARPTYDLVVCPESGQGACVPFPQVTPPWSAQTKTLTMDAPAAGQAVPIKLVACIAARSPDSVSTCGRRLADASRPADIRFLFKVRLNSFTVQHTRARTSDTVFYSLGGISSGQPVPAAGTCAAKTAEFLVPHFCVGPRRFGDVRDGTHVLNVDVGEFGWVPGRMNSLTFAFATMNYGQPVLPLGGPVVDMTSVSTIVLLTKLTAPDSGVLEDFTPELNDRSGWRGCDGPTAAGAKRLYNYRSADRTEPTVDELTRQTGTYSPPPSKVFVVPSQTGCGDSSKYQVRWTIERTSWRAF